MWSWPIPYNPPRYGGPPIRTRLRRSLRKQNAKNFASRSTGEASTEASESLCKSKFTLFTRHLENCGRTHKKAQPWGISRGWAFLVYGEDAFPFILLFALTQSDAQSLLAPPADAQGLLALPADAQGLLALPADARRLFALPADAQSLLAPPADAQRLLALPARSTPAKCGEFALLHMRALQMSVKMLVKQKDPALGTPKTGPCCL